MKEFFEDLYAYNHHINQKMADMILLHQKTVSDRNIQLFNHLVNAHHVWNNRILGTPGKIGVWDLHPLDELIKIDHENLSSSLHILDIDLERNIDYINTENKSYTNSVRDILFHIINHSTHHRAQITSDLKLHKIEPLVTDYIVFKRVKNL